MNEPLRLRDETDDEIERLLLRSADEDGLSREAVARLSARLGVNSPGAAPPVPRGGATGAQFVKASLATAAKWLGILALAGAGVAVYHWSWRGRGRDVEMEVVPSARVDALERPAAPPVESAESPGLASPEVDRSSRAIAARPQAPVRRAAALVDEIAMLESARVALSRHDANAALRVIERYDRAFDKRTLGPEASMIRIEALVAQGKQREAATLAERFLATSQGAPYEVRIRSMLPGLAERRDGDASPHLRYPASAVPPTRRSRSPTRRRCIRRRWSTPW